MIYWTSFGFQRILLFLGSSLLLDSSEISVAVLTVEEPSVEQSIGDGTGATMAVDLEEAENETFATDSIKTISNAKAFIAIEETRTTNA